MLFTSVNPAYLFIVYGFQCVYWKVVCMYCVLCTHCTTLYTQHVVVISINVFVCSNNNKKDDHWIRTNMMNLRACYWIINWNFWPLNTIAIEHKTKQRPTKTSQNKKTQAKAWKKWESLSAHSKFKPIISKMANVTL